MLRLVFRLVEWYRAWTPIEEFVAPLTGLGD
jgi:hypothetical protein